MECADVTAKKRKSQTGICRAACLVEGVLDLHVVSDSETVSFAFRFQPCLFRSYSTQVHGCFEVQHVHPCLQISLAFFLIYVASSCLQACA